STSSLEGNLVHGYTPKYLSQPKYANESVAAGDEFSLYATDNNVIRPSVNNMQMLANEFGQELLGLDLSAYLAPFASSPTQLSFSSSWSGSPTNLNSFLAIPSPQKPGSSKSATAPSQHQQQGKLIQLEPRNQQGISSSLSNMNLPPRPEPRPCGP